MRGEETARIEPLLGSDAVGALLVPTAVVDFAAATRALLRDCQVMAGASLLMLHYFPSAAATIATTLEAK